jgi:hypothetical protein
MDRRTILGALLAGTLLALPLAVRADTTPDGRPTAAEQPFVSKVTADLQARFPTAADAVKAGYLRYTDEDETGAISYANREWTSADTAHPSQLWYDVKGKLLGADYSVPLSATPPKLWGVDPARWQTFHAHVHYGLAGPGGTTVFGATGAMGIAKGGGTVEHPTPQALAAAGIATSPSDVKFVFEFPAIWDLEIWVVPNPKGAFADSDPDVKPSHPKKMSM